MGKGIGHFLWLVFRAMRPQQWVKNLFVAAPAFFALDIFNPACLWPILGATGAFSLLCGSVYMLNDIQDRELDCHHPRKCKRPIASGDLAPGTALLLALIISILALGILFALDARAGWVAVVYGAVNVAYSLGLKRVMILDVMLIALGFVLRLLLGAAAGGISLSPWILLMTYELTLFMGLVKRRSERRRINPRDLRTSSRRNLHRYPLGLLDQLIAIVTAATLVSYSLYVLDPLVQERLGSNLLIVTVPMVMFGLFRYLYLSTVKDKGESPEEVLFGDLSFVLNLVLWGGLFVTMVGLKLHVPW